MTSLHNLIVLFLIICIGVLVYLTLDLKNNPAEQKNITDNSSNISYSKYDPAEYTPEELETIIQSNENLVILDVRSPDEYNKGHVPNAINIPYDDVNQLATVDKTKEVVVYCTMSAWRAPYAAYTLQTKIKHPNVSILLGGLSYWKEEIGILSSKGDSTTGEVAPKPADLIPHSPTMIGNLSTQQLSFTKETLPFFNGQNGSPAYVAVDGLVYDVTASPLWKDGIHRPAVIGGFIEVKAGADISNWLIFSPHGKKNLERFPVVGIYTSE